MADFLVPVVEVILAFLAVAIYGSEAKPRHPILRNTVRLIAFGGAPVSAASILGLLGDVEFPGAAPIIWVACALIVISAEYYVGSKKIGYAALTVGVVWFLVVIFALVYL